MMSSYNVYGARGNAGDSWHMEPVRVSAEPRWTRLMKVAGMWLRAATGQVDVMCVGMH